MSTPWTTALQAVVAVGLFAAWNLGIARGEFVLGAYVVMALVWPPRVAWPPVHARSVLRAYLPFLLAWVVFLVLYLRAMHAVGLTVAPQPLLRRVGDEGLAGASAAGLFVGIVVIGPLLEEHVFRGYLLTGLRRVLPAAGADVVTAVVFGAFHGWQYALPVGLLGYFFGRLRVRHEALLPGVYAHGLHNGIMVCMTMLWPGHLDLLYPR